MTDEIKKEKLKENEADCTAEAFEEFVNEKERTGRELSDNDLEQASGGVLPSADDPLYMDYKTHNHKAMKEYLEGLVSSGCKLYEPKTYTTYRIQATRKGRTPNNPDIYGLFDVSGKNSPREVTSNFIYRDILYRRYEVRH